jgi:glutathione S-transferase
MSRTAPDVPHLVALRERVRARPRIATYLASPRRLAFNNNGIFRRYPELDGDLQR